MRVPGFLVAVALTLTVLAACRVPMPAAERDWRSGRERAIREELPPAQQQTFHGLRFYPYDADLEVRVMLEPIEPPEAIRIEASDGSVRPAHRIGRVSLRLPGGTGTLSVYRLDDLPAQYRGSLFVPFRDASAGRETYGAGRYVDVERLPGGVVRLDFNRAYNPDCAYGIAAQCPITPAENTLAFAVEGGEMMPAGH